MMEAVRTYTFIILRRIASVIWYPIFFVVNLYIRGAPTLFGGYQYADSADICAQITKSPSSNFITGSGAQACVAMIDNIVNSCSVFWIYAGCLLGIVVRVMSRSSQTNLTQNSAIVPVVDLPSTVVRIIFLVPCTKKWRKRRLRLRNNCSESISWTAFHCEVATQIVTQLVRKMILLRSKDNNKLRIIINQNIKTK